MKEIFFKSSSVAISPQKMNLIAKLVRKKELSYALKVLNFFPKKAAKELYNLLLDVSKKLSKEKQNINKIYLGKIEINKGRVRKKMMFRAKGRSDIIKKRCCLVNFRLIFT